MRKWFIITCALLLCVLGVTYAHAALVVPNEIEQPGTQPGEVGNLETPDKCDNCHGGYDQAVEPAYNWRGSMMANATRDPIFWATLAVAEQDYDGSGDLCIRCHSTSGWYSGRSTPTDGSALTAADANGVDCDTCHKMTNTNNSEHLGVMIAPFIANDGAGTGYYGSGILSLWAGAEKLGPYSETGARHQFMQSKFHRDISFCGSCHDVSNPAVGDLAHNNGAQIPLAPGTFSGVPGSPLDGKAAFNNLPYQYGIVERTFSEYMAGSLSKTLVSNYASLPADLKAGAIKAAFDSAKGNYADGSPRYFSCQTCHMRAVTGYGANKSGIPLRSDLPLHDMTGGNYWMPDVILYQNTQNTLRLGGGLTAEQISAITAGKNRAIQQLNLAASLSVSGNTLKVTNLTGHKLISGYPEGRRMWLNIKWYDASSTLLREEGKYDTVASINGKPVKSLVDLYDPNGKVYEAHYGMTQEWANQLIGLGYSPSLPLSYDRVTGAVTKTLGQLAAQVPGTSHETFHFVLNNLVVKDNRVPPFGMSYDEARKRNSLPVPANQYGSPTAGGTYNYWDAFSLNPPSGAVTAEIRLLYQPTSWEYIQFLYLANNKQNAFLANEGDNLLAAWLNTGMAEPHVMASTTWTGTPQPPGDFGKISPSNGAAGQPTSPTLAWENSSGAASYEYCYDSSNDNACAGWTSAGSAKSVVVSGLSYSTTYYWQVRAINPNGTTYANGSETAYWAFTTQAAPPLPGHFNKVSPGSGATNQPTNPTLTWETSANAAGYEYCIDTTNDNACTGWTSTGTATSKSLSGLSYSTTYYWQVRANNANGTTYANGSETAYWSFTTQAPPLPGSFSKSSPSNGATDQPLNPTLVWQTSAGAEEYAYCIDTTNDNACTGWTSTGTATSKSLSGLSYGTTYYWQVRATNVHGTTYANDSETAYWSFTTEPAPLPGDFSKTGPISGAADQPTNPTLTWEPSAGAASYEYCMDTTNDSACASWTSVGSATSKQLIGLSYSTTYYWQVRAINVHGTTYANGSATAYWSFTTMAAPPLPGAFSKSSPTSGTGSLPLNPTLSWETSANASDYEYCYDTTNDNACAGWMSAGSATSKQISGLSYSTTYYWQVRANNANGTTYANGSEADYWSFTTQAAPLPGSFSKISPTGGAVGQPTSITLDWENSDSATSYEYCYDDTNDSACTGWTSTGTATSKTLSGLSYGTTYYWQVRANNVHGSTYANGSETAYWSFTTLAAPQPPGDFEKLGPPDGASGQPTSLAISWGPSSGASVYEYCIFEPAVESACTGWSSAGTATSKQLAGLSYSTTYSWQVRAVNADGTTYADGAEAAYWTFTTIAAPQLPGSFNKINPGDGATDRPTNLLLDWADSSGAATYEYCYDTTDDNACTGWVSTGSVSSASLSGLNRWTTYYWQARAVNANGTTYANGSETAYWSFTTLSWSVYLPAVMNLP